MFSVHSVGGYNFQTMSVKYSPLHTHACFLRLLGKVSGGFLPHLLTM